MKHAKWKREKYKRGKPQNGKRGTGLMIFVGPFAMKWGKKGGVEIDWANCEGIGQNKENSQEARKMRENENFGYWME